MRKPKPFITHWHKLNKDGTTTKKQPQMSIDVTCLSKDPPFATDTYEITNRQLEKMKMEAFKSGAHWSRAETIKEVVELLKSKEAEDKFFTRASFDGTGSDWADWLEKELEK